MEDLLKRGVIEAVCRGDGKPCPSWNSCELECVREREAKAALDAAAAEYLKKVT